jgi:hypothetical protein
MSQKVKISQEYLSQRKVCPQKNCSFPQPPLKPKVLPKATTVQPLQFHQQGLTPLFVHNHQLIR